LGFLLFLLPVMVLMTYLSWPILVDMFVSGETSPNAGGLIRWPAMSLLPLGFGLLVLQGLSELGKRVLWLRGRIEMTMHYEKPLQ
jgi:TRAP-type mannitol/chloroaromatic compound transport system permease small subunit